MLPKQSPLRQFNELPMDVIQKLEENPANTGVSRLRSLSSKELGQFIRNQKHGSQVLALARQVPHLAVEVEVLPITRSILRLSLNLQVDFVWSDRFHGKAEPFWVWVEDGENGEDGDAAPAPAAPAARLRLCLFLCLCCDAVHAWLRSYCMYPFSLCCFHRPFSIFLLMQAQLEVIIR